MVMVITTICLVVIKNFEHTSHVKTETAPFPGLRPAETHSRWPATRPHAAPSTCARGSGRSSSWACSGSDAQPLGKRRRPGCAESGAKKKKKKKKKKKRANKKVKKEAR
jgi:hypothetical protein